MQEQTQESSEIPSNNEDVDTDALAYIRAKKKVINII